MAHPAPRRWYPITLSLIHIFLAEAAMPVSPAELHGHLLGRVCAGAGFDEAAWQHAAAELLGGAPGERLKAALSGLLGMVRQDFSAGEVAVVMLLPDDETPLAQRTEALEMCIRDRCSTAWHSRGKCCRPVASSSTWSTWPTST